MMPLRNSTAGYGTVARAFHWVTVALVLLAWMLPHIRRTLSDLGLHGVWLPIHMWSGLLILLLLVGRLVWRFGDSPPGPVVTPLGIWGDRAALAGHVVLYFLLLAIPATGILLQFVRGGDLPIFGVFTIASPWIENRNVARTVRSVHDILANTILIVAALHAGAALVHHFIFRDRVLTRMLIGASE
jgi:cytochrome b561